MSLVSRLLGRLFALPPAETHDLVIERDLAVPMPDGAVLLADHYAPRGGAPRPVILVRCPYGRAGAFGLLFGPPLAERGFQVLIQSCRGTFGSGGVLDPFHNERADGLATVAWLKQQPWFNGAFATLGPSYLGFTQWAIATEVGPELKAMAVQVSSSEFRSPIYGGESFWLDTALTWATLVENQEKSAFSLLLSPFQATRAVSAAEKHLPLRSADTAALGKTVPYYQDWLVHNAPGDPWWTPIDFSDRVPEVTAPVSLLGGWYDLFLPQTLADYARLRGAGRDPQLLIGPWTHGDRAWLPVAMRESLAWFRAHLLGDKSGLRAAPIRVFVMGAGTWRDFPEWPPPGSATQRWHLQPRGGLAKAPPDASEPDRYRYDPADPTPAVGGCTLSQNAGAKDNRALEARADVLVYTSAPLDRDVEVIGPVAAELFVQSSLEHTDFFARLCVVLPSGKSLNVSDGILRLTPGRVAADADGWRKITVEMWPTAQLFKRGQRIRVQVSSGSHPRYARNPGSEGSLATATTLVAADQSIHHDPAHPSAILLPVAR